MIAGSQGALPRHLPAVCELIAGGHEPITAEASNPAVCGAIMSGGIVLGILAANDPATEVFL